MFQSTDRHQWPCGNQIIKAKEISCNTFLSWRHGWCLSNWEKWTCCSHPPCFSLPSDLLLAPFPGLLEHLGDEEEGRDHLSTVLTRHYENGVLSGNATWLSSLLLLAPFTDPNVSQQGCQRYSLGFGKAEIMCITTEWQIEVEKERKQFCTVQIKLALHNYLLFCVHLKGVKLKAWGSNLQRDNECNLQLIEIIFLS